ncbi:hypothetical protein QCE63_22430 [Caballeronia sp. LZ065]|uniref:hypothetical protein n=1 Tax=Caballeronia sp. LZ065 TaxID=3038571 RepID=UPI00285A175D|nr:hypothetical protein [Caballeronia sp. LZ065]MDR5782162.1 hypothetical protein [Caballeronia sp. LZ065]
MLLSKQRSVAACAVWALLCCCASTRAAETQGTHAERTIGAASGVTGENILAVESLPPGFAGDDPEHVRDALAGRPAPGQAPSITSRVRTFLAQPFRRWERGASGAHGASQAQSASATQADRTFVFVIPVSYGVRYQSKKKILTVNVSLAAPGNPNAILLKQTVKGQSGRKLVVAAEARAKGFVQTFDVIQLQPDGGARTTVTGRALLPNFAHEHSEGDFAIVLVCALEPPYLTDDVEHSAPSEEEPTDVTRRTSTLNGSVAAAWLVDRKDGSIVTRRLRLVK